MTDASKDPEWRLAAEVLRQAVEDAACQPGQNQLTFGDIEEARQFCASPEGDWASAREDWCEAAGIHPDIVRGAVLRLLGASA